MPIKLLIQSEMCCSGYFSCDCYLYVDSFPYLVTKEPILFQQQEK